MIATEVQEEGQHLIPPVIASQLPFMQSIYSDSACSQPYIVFLQLFSIPFLYHSLPLASWGVSTVISEETGRTLSHKTQTLSPSISNKANTKAALLSN